MKEKLDNIFSNKWNYIFLTPMLILFFSFTIYPMYNIATYSFFEWDGYGPLDKMVGFRNYIEVLSDPYYWNAFRHTMIFALSHLVLQTAISLVLAVALNGLKNKMSSAYRLMIFLPVITTTAVIGMVMSMIFSPINGPINMILSDIGLIQKPIMFLSSPKLVLWTTISVSLWKTIGVSLVYWMAALQTVPADVYESAKMDGANILQVFFKITLPLVAPFGAIIGLFAFKNGLYPFDVVKVMTNGGPSFSSDVIDSYLYRYAFNAEQSVIRYGFASAGGIAFAVIVIVITLVANNASKKIGEKHS